MASSPPEPAVPATRAWRALLGPVVFAVLLAAPLPLTWEQHALVAVYGLAVTYWISEALPVGVTALLAATLLVVLGIAPARTAFGAFGDPVLFLFLGSLILAEALRTTGLDRRLALAVLNRDWASASPRRLLLAIGLVTATVSLVVSNTATTALMVPVGRGILASLGQPGDPGLSRYSIGFMLMLTWSSSVAVGLPMASPPNLIAIGMLADLAAVRLTFLDWVLVAMPLTFAMLALCWALLAWRYPAPASAASDVRRYVADARSTLGAWTAGQRNVALVFALAVGLWIAPGVASALPWVTPNVAMWLESRLPESVVALGAVALLFALPVRRGDSPALTWQQAVRIDWGTILLFGGGLALGRAAFDTGLAEVAGSALVAATDARDLWTLTAVAIVLGVVMSELSSNTASASAVVPLVIAVTVAGGLNPVPPVLGAALGASFGFMLPISTPPNAIVYGSGLVPLREMVRAGLLLDVSGAVVIWAGLRVLCPLAGLA